MRYGLLHLNYDGTDMKIYTENDGTKRWYSKGFLHRIDGPAIENIDGNNFWYLYGKKISERKFKNHPIVIAHREKQFLEQTVSETKSSKKAKL